MECKHEQFECNLSVTKLTDDNNQDIVIGYATELTVKCVQCGIPFEWLGLQSGYAPSHPMVSFDATTLRAPIRPSTDPVESVKQLLK